ncbi:hypothetical protein E2C01_050584 [Portunus trituberculatus]|uniref:Uncharacterized protein n=1 Tax=Portunus trituberculatus TaxID=210409 RepID=A0A5B7G8Q0_PORTR|nr:hypothetical protein [Portunus trituberculatus]
MRRIYFTRRARGEHKRRYINNSRRSSDERWQQAEAGHPGRRTPAQCPQVSPQVDTGPGSVYPAGGSRYRREERREGGRRVAKAAGVVSGRALRLAAFMAARLLSLFCFSLLPDFPAAPSPPFPTQPAPAPPLPPPPPRSSSLT